ncbi:MAG: type II toxin-antitoxin system VapC family toxin [Acidobacteriia bacterium]|nr:type II toxin-antitoxin system VapC family toxin [Terriglobia bacterium]
MILADVNVLLHAFRSDSPDHAPCRRWLESVVNGSAAYAMSPQVLSSMVRVATHPRIYARPSRLEDALDFCGVLLDQPHCQVVQPGPRHWEIFSRLCREARTTGSLVQDAWFAAIAIEYGCHWITLDNDFTRFKGLNTHPPG